MRYNEIPCGEIYRNMLRIQSYKCIYIIYIYSIHIYLYLYRPPFFAPLCLPHFQTWRLIVPCFPQPCHGMPWWVIFLHKEDDESTRRFTTWNAWLGRTVGIGTCNFTPMRIWLRTDKHFLSLEQSVVCFFFNMHLIEITLWHWFIRSLNRICPGEKPQSGKYERDGLVDVSKMVTWMTSKLNGSKTYHQLFGCRFFWCWGLGGGEIEYLIPSDFNV